MVMVDMLSSVSQVFSPIFMFEKPFFTISTCAARPWKSAPSEAPLIWRKAFRPWLCFSHTSNSCWGWMVMNTAADMYPAPESRCRDEAVVLLYCMPVCVCVCYVSVGGEGMKSHFLIRSGPSWPSALQWELVQHCTGTTGFLSGYWPKKLLRAGSQTIHTHTYLSLRLTHKHAW